MNIAKVKLASLGGLLAHDLRFDGDGIEHVQIGRGQGEKIDPTRTCLNRVIEKRPDGEGWELRVPTLSDRRKALRRLRDAKDSHKKIRGRSVGKNAVTASLVATKPKDWPGTDAEFIEVTASYLDSQPGETLAMVVHFDETTPHIHCVKLLTSDDGCIQGFNSVYDRGVYQRFHAGMVEFSESMGFPASWVLDEKDEVGKALSGLDQRRYGIIKERLSEVESREAAVGAREAELDRRWSELSARQAELQDALRDAQRRSSDALRAVLRADEREKALDEREKALDALKTALDERQASLDRREDTLGLRAKAEAMRQEPDYNRANANAGKTMAEYRW